MKHDEEETQRIIDVVDDLGEYMESCFKELHEEIEALKPDTHKEPA